MDQDTAWWTTVVFGTDEDTDLPRYAQIVAAVERAVDTRLVTYGQRLPAERTLAAALCVSRGTVVRAFEELADRGVVERLHGSGTFVRPRPTTARPLARHIDSSTDDIGEAYDLSGAAPLDPAHLPAVDWSFDPAQHGPGLSAQGLPVLRAAVAAQLTHRGLPTDPDQIVVTTGAAESLDLVLRIHSAGKRPAVLGAPMWPALRSVLTDHTATSLWLPPDTAGIDPAAVRRALRRTRAAVAFVDVVESGPRGVSTAPSRLARLAAAIEDHTAVAVEDLSFLPLATDDPPLRPLAALSERVTAIGDLSRMFWTGCGIGWIREPSPAESLLTAFERLPRPAISAQVHAARLLDAATPQWCAERRADLAERVAHLRAALAELVPSWVVEPSTSGDGLWIRLPVVDASTFAHVAARGGVRVGLGRECVTDGGLREYIRISAAADIGVLEAAVDRLVEAWETYTRRLAASV